LRFLLDENVPVDLAVALAAQGHDAALLPPEMRSADDAAVLALAARRRRVLITLDTDFGALVFLHRRPVPPAVVLIRMPAAELIAKLTQVAQAIVAAATTPRTFIAIDSTGVRVRPIH
jgi:predicted nuclease of predicted toxin-antitoxin system